jgi:hypothetical protein
VFLTDGRHIHIISADPHFQQNVEDERPMSESSVLSTEGTDAQQNFTHSVQPVEIRLFSVKMGLCASLDLFIDALSYPLIIAATDVSRIAELNRIVRSTKGTCRETSVDVSGLNLSRSPVL